MLALYPHGKEGIFIAKVGNNADSFTTPLLAPK